jgi:hypothetical protein
MKELELLKEIEKAIFHQKEKLIKMGQKKMHPFTEEELYQPFDCPSLANDPEFLYEEGIYHGQLGVMSLIKAFISESGVRS